MNDCEQVIGVHPKYMAAMLIRGLYNACDNIVLRHIKSSVLSKLLHVFTDVGWKATEVAQRRGLNNDQIHSSGRIIKTAFCKVHNHCFLSERVN